MCFHISGHTLSGLDVIGFFVNFSPDHGYPSRGFSFNKMNLVKRVHAPENSLSPSKFVNVVLVTSSDPSFEVRIMDDSVQC